MIFKFIVLASVAVGLAGFMMALHKLTRGFIPRWTILVAAAAGVIGYPVFDEYNWHQRKLTGLSEAPGQFVVVGVFEGKSWLRPWSIIKAPIARIDAVNIERNKLVEGRPDLIENFIGVSRQSGQASSALFLFDCPNARFGPRVQDLANTSWAPMPRIMQEALCKSS